MFGPAATYDCEVTLAWLLVPAAYLVGMFPTAQLIGGAVGHDPTLEGSGNPGASNVFRVAGRRAGIVVLVGDVLKALVPTLLGYAVGGRPLAAACGAAAMLGHVFPVRRNFQGGKGVATFGATTLVLWPGVAIAALALWAVLVRVSKRASIGSIVGAAAIPVGVAFTGRPIWEVMVSAGMAFIVIARHYGNLSRLLGRREATLERGA